MKKLLLRVLAVLALLVVVLVGFVWWRSSAVLNDTWRVSEAPLAIPDDADSVAWGHHVAVTRGCTDCHSADMGGRVVMHVAPIGQLGAPNLTTGKGGVVRGFTAVDWEHAIRHGLKPDGHSVLFMPTSELNGLTDTDTADLIAWLRQLPPVDRPSPGSYLGPVGRTLLAFGKLPAVSAATIDQKAPHVATLQPAPTAAYGAYLAQGCTGCHGPHLSGGPMPGQPPGIPNPANLTPDHATGLGGWTRDDFVRALRQGRRPDGTALNEFMPWKNIGQGSDTELDALWAYLQSLPPRKAGQR